MCPCARLLEAAQGLFVFHENNKTTQPFNYKPFFSLEIYKLIIH